MITLHMRIWCYTCLQVYLFLLQNIEVWLIMSMQALKLTLITRTIVSCQLPVYYLILLIIINDSTTILVHAALLLIAITSSQVVNSVYRQWILIVVDMRLVLQPHLILKQPSLVKGPKNTLVQCHT